ncbi:hypothetical protein LTR08_008066 [Meristemomyces frigidus]|nr:hypothetical protein LTR08_008066 [Meristemomyces frigidus]
MTKRKRQTDHAAPDHAAPVLHQALPIRTKRLRRNAPIPFTIDPIPTTAVDPTPLAPSVNGDICAPSTFADLPLDLLFAGVKLDEDDEEELAFDQPVYTTIIDRYKFAPLALCAKPMTNKGKKSHFLAQVRLVWKSELDDLLDRNLQPSQAVMEWPRQLLEVLARLAWYGDPDEINGLLRHKVYERQTKDGGESTVRVKEMYAVLDDMLKEGRQIQQPAEDDGFSLV